MGEKKNPTRYIMAAPEPDVKILFVRVPGGEVPPVPALAPKVGPLKLSPKSVGEDLAKATKDWKGMRVTCKLIVVNRKVSVEVIPSATALLIKALKEPPRDKKKEKEIQHDGDITYADMMAICTQMRERSMAKEMAGTVKEILGTARAIGCTIDGRDPEEWVDEINENGLPDN